MAKLPLSFDNVSISPWWGAPGGVGFFWEVVAILTEISRHVLPLFQEVG